MRTPSKTPRKTCSNQDHQDFPLKNNPKKNPTHREIHFKTQRSISQSLGFGTSAQQGTDRLAGLWGFTVAYCRHCTFLGAVDPISLDPFRKVGVKTPGNMGWTYIYVWKCHIKHHNLQVWLGPSGFFEHSHGTYYIKTSHKTRFFTVSGESQEPHVTFHWANWGFWCFKKTVISTWLDTHLM